MTADQTASLIYLGVLAMVIGSYVVVASRANIGRSMRHAALWGLIFLALYIGYLYIAFT